MRDLRLLKYSKYGDNMRVKLRTNKTKKGSEYLFADFTDNDGKRQRKALKLENTPENRKLANNVIIPRISLSLEESKGEFFKNKIPTVNEFIKKSIDMHRSERNQTTHDDYLNIYKNHINDIFGKKRLDEIKVSDVKQWQTDLLEVKGLSESRVNTIRVVFSLMFKDAINDEIIEKNPFDRVASPTIPISDTIPFTSSEMLHIISQADGQLQNFIATGFLTGARSGEMIALKWCDIDFENKSIRIERSIRNGVTSNTKTKYANSHLKCNI